ncbi:hypothetical protein T4E_753 [Trichinella pseudospiralis]|uniref:Uncharacterized protein n=1 Tax=Trichinella pseudospiralis TaxID=6337 RepID=A0A0V0YE49_TRIPS|nr:hypothetical protein T4E_753 [Trichinella pseudospiralis]
MHQLGMQLKAMSLLEVTLYQLKLWRRQQCSTTTTVLSSTGGRSLPNFIYQEDWWVFASAQEKQRQSQEPQDLEEWICIFIRQHLESML